MKAPYANHWMLLPKKLRLFDLGEGEKEVYKRKTESVFLLQFVVWYFRISCMEMSFWNCEDEFQTNSSYYIVSGSAYSSN